MRVIVNIILLFSCLIGLQARGGGRDFYKILNIPKNAKEKQIKKAYRELSRKWHPDQNPDNKEEATEKFYDISAAYETLIDPEKRSKYDLGGEEAVNGQGGGGQGGFRQGDPFQQFQTFFQFFGGEGGGFPGGGFHHGGNGGFHHQPPVQNMYDEKSGVTEIANANDWNAKVAQRTDVVVVDFYSPQCRPCQDLKDQYISVAKKFAGIVQVLAVNCQGQMQKSICQSERIQNYPSIRLYSDSNKVHEFSQSQARNSKNIGNWIANAIPDFTTKINSKSSLDKLVSSAGSKAVVILFSDKKETPAMYKSLCRTFKSNVACGLILGYSLTTPPSFVAESVSKQIQKTPALFYVHDSLSFEGEFFKGSMTSEIISLFFSRIVSHKSRQVSVEQLTSSRTADCSPSDGSICVLLLDNPTSGSPKAANHYELFKKLAERFKSDPVKFFWVDSKSKFTNLFGGAKIVAFRGKRKKYSAFENIENATFESLSSWIDNIVTGGISLTQAVAGKASHDEL
jgi:curved DNA-binding protein CbpA